MFRLLLSLPVLPRHAKMKGPVYQVTKMASLNASARKASLEISARKVRRYLQLPGWISIYLHKICSLSRDCLAPRAVCFYYINDNVAN